MVDPEPCKELRRRIFAAIYGWDCPLLTFIYLGFDCGSIGNARHGIHHELIPHKPEIPLRASGSTAGHHLIPAASMALGAHKSFRLLWLLFAFSPPEQKTKQKIRQQICSVRFPIKPTVMNPRKQGTPLKNQPGKPLIPGQHCRRLNERKVFVVPVWLQKVGSLDFHSWETKDFPLGPQKVTPLEPPFAPLAMGAGAYGGGPHEYNVQECG